MKNFNIEDNIKIYIITHKEFAPPIRDCYIPLLVGADLKPELVSKYLGDNSGDNISHMNDSYCELTGLYWIWKNTNDRYVGLVHYRRFFVKGNIFRCGSRYYSIRGNKSVRLLNHNDIIKYLNKYDVLVKESRRYRVSIKEVFNNHTHIGHDKWERFRQIVFDNYPEYIEDFLRMENEHTLVNCNMFIGSKNIIDNYCLFLFDVLFKIDKDVIEDNGDRYHNREMGYFGEFLFGLWLNHNKINYYVLDAVNISEFESEDSVLKLWKIIPMTADMIRSRFL